MAFPTSPSNNQVHSESGSNRTYVYDSTLGVWDQVKEAQSDVSNIAGHISNEVTGFTGIKNCDSWRIHTTFYATSSVQTINKNWERVDTNGVGHIGQGLSERNGVFAFPATGIWHIAAHFQMNGNGAARTYFTGRIQTTEDDQSSWSDASRGIDGAFENGAYGTVAVHHIFKVTNITTHMVRFQADGSGDTRFLGDSSHSNTYVIFQRIGEL